MATNTTITISAVDKTQRAFSSVESSLKKMTGAITATQAAVGGLVASFAANQFTSFLDTATRIENKLKLVTESSNDLAQAQAEVYRVSQTTGAGLEQTAELYSKIVSSTEALNLSSKDQIRITETISKAISISGASAEGAAGAITQLGQALGSGALRGEEFNSVNEQAPRIMQALADSLGVTRGSLKKLASDGALTAEIVTEALLLQSETIDSEYSRTATTVAESFTKLKNSAVVFFGVLDDNTGISTLFSEALAQMARGLKNVTDAMKPATVQSLTKEIQDLSNAQAKELLALDKLVTENSNLNVMQQNQARIMRLNTAERAEKIKKLRAELDSLNSIVAAQKEEAKETGNSTSASKLSAEQLERRRKLREQLNKLTGGTLELSKQEINYQNKIYEIGKKNSLVTGEVSQANKAYFESVKNHLGDAEAVLAAKQQEAVHAASSALSAMTLKDTTEGIGRLLATQGDTQTQLSAAVEAERIVREKVSQLAAATGDESQRQKATLQGMLPALGAQVNYLEDMLASEQGRNQEGVALAQKALTEQAAYEAIVAEVNQITEQQKIQSSLDLAQKALTEQAAYEQVLAQVEKITEEMRIQQGVDLAIESIKRQQAEDESLRLLQEQSKVALDIAAALDAAETLKAMKAQEEVLKEQEESVRFLNEQAGWQLARAVKLGQLQEEQALALAEQIRAQDAFNEGLMLTSDLYSYIKDEAKDLNKGIKEGAKDLADSPTFQAVTGAAGASGGRAMSIVQATKEGGLQEGLLSLVLSNEKVQEALGKVFDALFSLVDPIIEMLVPVINALIPVVDALRPIFQKLSPAVEKLAPLLVKVIELLEPLLNVLLQVINVFEGIFGSLEIAIESLLNSLPQALQNLGEKLEEFIKSIVSVIENLFNGIGDFVNGIVGAFTDIIDGFIKIIMDLPQQIWKSISQMFGSGTFKLFDYVVDIIKGMISAVGSIDLYSILSSAVSRILNIGGSVSIASILSNAVSSILNVGGSISIYSILSNAVNSIIRINNQYLDIWSMVFSKVQTIFSNVGTSGFNLVSLLSSAVNKIFKAIVPSGKIPLLPNPFNAFGLGPKHLLEFSFAQGGYLRGPSHAQGGMPAMVGGKRPVELEGGEFIIRKSAVQSLGLETLYALNSATNFNRAQQVRDAMSMNMFAAGGLADQWRAYKPPFFKTGVGLSLRDLGSIGNKIADIFGNHGAEFKLQFPNQSSARIYGIGGLISGGNLAGNVNKEFFNAGNDLFGRAKASFTAGFFPPSMSMSASYKKPAWLDWLPFATGGQIPEIRNGAASIGNYSSAVGGIEVNIYDGTGQRISEYDSSLRVEIKERAARYSQFPAVA